ncbi:hypothetical protein [Methylococcus sp. Mc7]|uniref:hypothetical protein n=1 Tax=Methylococcus sp. Mc7 TaxID=2860258 RepID=UPI001C53181D|nr:hypothetical protein [Methylococcus sp. Mc7]QXP83024.1 hypothetical protein KW115_12545 [Methylococcus sp. Mc7]
MPTPKRSVTFISKDGTRCVEIKFRQFIKTPNGVEVSGPAYLNGEFLGPGTGTLSGVDFYDRKPGRRKGDAPRRLLLALSSLAAQVVFGDKPSRADDRIERELDVDAIEVRKARRHRDFYGLTALVHKTEDGTVIAFFFDGTAPDDVQSVWTLVWEPGLKPRLEATRIRAR